MSVSVSIHVIPMPQGKTKLVLLFLKKLSLYIGSVLEPIHSQSTTPGIAIVTIFSPLKQHLSFFLSSYPLAITCSRIPTLADSPFNVKFSTSIYGGGKGGYIHGLYFLTFHSPLKPPQYGLFPGQDFYQSFEHNPFD